MRCHLSLFILLVFGWPNRLFAQNDQLVNATQPAKWQVRFEPGYSFRSYAWDIADLNNFFFRDRSAPGADFFLGWAAAPSLSLLHQPSQWGLRYTTSLRYDSRNSVVRETPQTIPGLFVPASTDFEWRFFHDHEISLFTKINRAKKPHHPWLLGAGLSYTNANAGYWQTIVVSAGRGGLVYETRYVNLAANGYHLWANLPLHKVLGFPTPGLQLEPKLTYLPHNYPGLGQVMLQCRALYPLPSLRASFPPRTASPPPANGWAWRGLVGLTWRRVQLSPEIYLPYPNHLTESHTLMGSGVGLDLGMAIEQRRWGLSLQYNVTVRSEASRFFLANPTPLRNNVPYTINPQRDRPILVLDHELTLLKTMGRQGIRLGLGHAWLNAGQVVQVRNIVQSNHPEVLDWELPVGLRAWQLLAQLPLPKLFTLATPGLHLEPKFYYVYHNHPSQARTVPPLALGLKVFYQFHLVSTQP
jgi:hypothetical protein